MSSSNEIETIILKNIQEVEGNLTITRSKLKKVKLEVFNLETDLIGLKLNRENLIEELRKLRLARVMK